MSATALNCPRCRKRTPVALSWADATSAACGGCLRAFEFVPFPANDTTARVVRPGAVVEGEEASCFFHAENRAEAVCEGCGRYLCPVCAVNFGGRTLCPNCISAGKDVAPQLVTERVIYPSVALAIALVSCLLWFLSIVTAPLVLGLIIHGWKKPGSLVRSGRWRFIAAGLVALIQIGGWIVMFMGLSEVFSQ